MLSRNGHGPKRAVLYTRVSTDEQVRPKRSLAQQIEADLYPATPGVWLHPRDRIAPPKRR
jgi:hypothetical protein